MAERNTKPRGGKAKNTPQGGWFLGKFDRVYREWPQKTNEAFLGN